MYEQLLDATRLLLVSHKDISQQRRESLRLALNKDYHVICAALQNEKLTSNEFLFGEDLTKRAEEALKAKRLPNKLTGSNVANGNSRGRVIRTRPICSTRTRGADSHSTRTNGNMHTKICATKARGTQTDRRERLPQIQEIATSQVHQPPPPPSHPHPIIDNLKNTTDNFYEGKISDNFASWALPLISGFATSSGCTG